MTGRDFGGAAKACPIIRTRRDVRGARHGTGSQGKKSSAMQYRFHFTCFVRARHVECVVHSAPMTSTTRKPRSVSVSNGPALNKDREADRLDCSKLSKA